MEQITNRPCNNCGRPVRGRSDKKFCNDGCRNDYHNKITRTDNITVRNVNHALARNRNLLKQRLENKETTICSRLLLMNDGFHFDFITGIKSKENRTICYCYEYGYYLINQTTIKIINDKTFKI